MSLINSYTRTSIILGPVTVDLLGDLVSGWQCSRALVVSAGMAPDAATLDCLGSSDIVFPAVVIGSAKQHPETPMEGRFVRHCRESYLAVQAVCHIL